MKTLVTGANGLLGANLVRELLQRGYQVRALVRKGSDLRSLKGVHAELFYGDLRDEKTLIKACQGCEFVIHAGGKTPDHNSTFKEYMQVNVRGTQNMVRAMEKTKIKRMVFVSSCCVFGGGGIEDPGTELSEFTGFKFNSGYINSKYLAQQWVLSEVEKKGLPIVIVNPTILLGPFDTSSSSLKIIMRVIRNKFQLCPVTGKNFIDVRDAAIASCNALTMGIPGECYLLASENLTFSALFKKIYKIYGRQGMSIHVPQIVLNIAGLIGSAIQAISNQKLPLNLVNSRLLAYRSYFSAEKAVRELQLPQRPVDDAIRDTIKWFTSKRYRTSYLPYNYSIKSVA